MVHKNVHDLLSDNARKKKEKTTLYSIGKGCVKDATNDLVFLKFLSIEEIKKLEAQNA